MVKNCYPSAKRFFLAKIQHLIPTAIFSFNICRRKKTQLLKNCLDSRLVSDVSDIYQQIITQLLFAAGITLFSKQGETSHNGG